MIGYLDYSVWLTYVSLLSATLGIIVTLNGGGHPYYGIFFLLICGLCDTFDGKVARTKKDRTAAEKKYGIQIDSLSDLVAFGVLPVCIGSALMRVSPSIRDTISLHSDGATEAFKTVLLIVVMLIYILAAMMRLAFFNVNEEERQESEVTPRKYYAGLPVTSSVLIFPTVMLLQFVTTADITQVYFAVMLVTALMFVLNIKIPKPGMRGILCFIGMGAIEFGVFIFFYFFKS